MLLLCIMLMIHQYNNDNIAKLTKEKEKKDSRNVSV